MPQELTVKETLVLITSQFRTVSVIGPGQHRALGYLAQHGHTYRVIGRGSGAEQRRFTSDQVKCASLRGEEFAVVELKDGDPESNEPESEREVA